MLRLQHCSSLPSHVRIAIQERNKAKKEISKSSLLKRPIQIQKYRTMRNRVVSLIRKERKDQVTKSLSEGKHPWKVANKVLGQNTKENNMRLVEKGQELQGDEEKAKVLNKFFIDKVKTLKERINPTLRADPLSKIKPKESKFTFKRVNERDVLRTISAMKTSKCCGIDGITTEFLKLIKREVTPILVEMVNTSLATGQFPNAFKCAVITPIYKNKGSRTDKVNYRPISGLPVLGKCIETLVEIQLRSYFEQHNLLGHSQHGFRRNRSTSTALLSSIIKLREAKERRLYSGVLIFDLSAAYDVLDIKILLKKAALYGLDRTALAWLESYLTGRSQAVKVGTFIAEPAPLECGIPQGSSCSCLLFIIYVSDIAEWTSIGTQGFADDTLIFCHGANPSEVIKQLQDEAIRILTYFTSNELVANPTKTAFLMIRPTRKQDDCHEVRVGEALIKESSTEKVLGVQVSNSLKWKTHMEQVRAKMSRGIYTVKRLRPLLGDKQLRMVADGLVMSHVRYCAPVYLSEKVRLSSEDPVNQDLKQLQTKQNDMLRVLLRKKRIDHASAADMLESTRSLSINQMTSYTMLIETWKSINITKIFPFNQTCTSKRVLRSNTTQLLRSDTASSEPFTSKAIRLWTMTSPRFKTTNLLKIARIEALALAKTLPL